MRKDIDYHDTLSETVDEIGNRLTAAQIVLNTTAWADKIFERGHIAYGHTHSFDFEIATLKDRKTRKWFHVVIVRLDSGRYELNTYTL